MAFAMEKALDDAGHENAFSRAIGDLRLQQETPQLFLSALHLHAERAGAVCEKEQSRHRHADNKKRKVLTMENITKLMAIAITGKGTEQEIRHLTEQAETAVLESAGNINAEWLAAAEIKDREPFRIQKGTVKRNMAENEKDMFQGAWNRMHVTDRKDEFSAMLNSALYRIYALSQLALDKIGVIEIPEFEWKCPLKL